MMRDQEFRSMDAAQVTALPAKQDDTCLRDIPRVLTKEEIRYGTRHEGVVNETRTLIAPSWQLFLLAPWGLNYHLEHHLYPGITCFNLAKAHRILMTRAPYAETANITYVYWGLVRELASTKPGERSAAIEALELNRNAGTPNAAARRAFPVTRA
jgi:fatty acid desaturase